MNKNMSVTFLKHTEFDLLELIDNIPNRSKVLTMNGDRPRDGDHPRDDDHPIDHLYPPDSNPYPPDHSGSHPSCPDHLYWLLIKLSSTYTHIHIEFFDIMTTSAQRAAAVKSQG